MVQPERLAVRRLGTGLAYGSGSSDDGRAKKKKRSHPLSMRELRPRHIGSDSGGGIWPQISLLRMLLGSARKLSFNMETIIAVIASGQSMLAGRAIDRTATSETGRRRGRMGTASGRSNLWRFAVRVAVGTMTEKKEKVGTRDRLRGGPAPKRRSAWASGLDWGPRN